MKNREKAVAGLTWQEVAAQAGHGKKITVHYDGIQRSGYWYEDHMMKMFSGCELLQLTENDFQVEKWPDRSGK